MYTQIQLQLLQFLTHITWSQSHILSFSQTWISLLWNVLQTHTLTYCSVVKFLHSPDFITDTYCLLLSYVVSRSFSHTIGDPHTQITASYSPSTAIFFSQFVFASLTWTVFIHTMIHSCILCLRHPLASQPFAVNWLLTHALMTLVDMTALHKQFRTQFISQHWTTCLCTVKFLTHSPWQALPHFHAYRLSYFVDQSILLTNGLSNSDWFAVPTTFS